MFLLNHLVSFNSYMCVYTYVYAHAYTQRRERGEAVVSWQGTFSFFLSSSYVCAICSCRCGSSPSNMRWWTGRTELLSGGTSPSDYKDTQGRWGFQWSSGNGFKPVWAQQLLCPATSATWLSSGYGMVQGLALKPLHFFSQLVLSSAWLKIC